jgi:hypothetical protein
VGHGRRHSKVAKHVPSMPVMCRGGDPTRHEIAVCLKAKLGGRGEYKCVACVDLMRTHVWVDKPIPGDQLDRSIRNKKLTVHEVAWAGETEERWRWRTILDMYERAKNVFIKRPMWLMRRSRRP